MGVVHQTPTHDWLVVAVAIHLITQRQVHIGLALHSVVTLLINYSQ